MLARSRLLPLVLLSVASTLGACSSSKTEQASTNSEHAPSAAALPGLELPAWATTERYAGRLDPDAVVRVQVHLQLRNIDDARDELAARSDPASPRYRQFLSDAEIDAKYAPSDEDVAAVRAHLEANGLRVIAVPSNRAFVTAEGGAAQVERAFSTRLGTYAIGGETRRAPLDAASLPADVAPRVSAVLGLATPRRAKPALVLRRDSRAHAASPGAKKSSLPPDGCADYWGQYLDTSDPPFGPGYAKHPSYALCSGYVPAQVRTMYGFEDSVRAGNDGTGQTIAIVDAWASPTLLQDAQAYAANNDPAYPLAASQLTIQSPAPFASPPDTGWYSEETLDVEAAHALAPKASLVLAAASSDSDDDLVAALNLIITDHLASVVSESWGFEEKTEDQASFTAYEQVILRGSLQGIGFYFATGDSGDDSLDDALFGAPGTPPGPSASFPASLPEVTAVGGTSVALGKGNEIVFEVGWEEGAGLLLPAGFEGSWNDYLDGNLVPPSVDAGAEVAWWPAAPGAFSGSGAGGGASTHYVQPWYQKGIVPASIAGRSGAAWRVVPDVAMLADAETGFQIGLTFEGQYLELPSGGTSLAAPLFVASVALAQQLAGRPLGFLNPLLYGGGVASEALRDVRPAATTQLSVVPLDPTNLVIFDYHGPGNSLRTAPGFDDVTGLGSPSGAAFLRALGRGGR